MHALAQRLWSAQAPSCRHLIACLRPPTPPSCSYGDGSVRFTVEENVILPNVPQERLAALQADPLFQRFPVHGGELGFSCDQGFCIWLQGRCSSASPCTAVSQLLCV